MSKRGRVMANIAPLKDDPAFLIVKGTSPYLHVDLLATDRWELIKQDMGSRAQHVRSELASRVQELVQRHDDDAASVSLALDIVSVLVHSFIMHDGAMGHEHTLEGVKSLASHPTAFDQALVFFFDVASTFLQNARSRYQMKLLVERDVVRSYDRALHDLVARHCLEVQTANLDIPWSPAWAIRKVEWFRLEFEERYDGLLSAFGGTTLFKDPYLSKTHRLLVRIQRRATAEMVVMKAVGNMLPQELVDCIADCLYDNVALAHLLKCTISAPTSNCARRTIGVTV